MKQKIKSKITTYCCSSHILNVLCRDVETKNIKENEGWLVLDVKVVKLNLFKTKYFRYKKIAKIA